MPTPVLPDWSVSQWMNIPVALSLADLRGKVVVIEAFQMLCPGCVSHGLPLAQEIDCLFPERDVAVIGLHTVFEHHSAMGPVSLAAFLHEYGITFPVGIDEAGEDAIPVTMRRYGLRGTPSILIVDKEGCLAHHYYGAVSAMQLGKDVAALVAKAPQDTTCDIDGCRVPA